MSRRWWLVVLVMIVSVVIGLWLLKSRHDALIVSLDRRCRDLKKEHNWTDLASVASQWSKIDPNSADAWLFRSEAAEGLKDWDAVVQTLDRVPRTDRRAVGALVRKSIVEFENLNRPLDGVKTCDEVLQLEPRVLIANKQTIFFYAMTLQRTEMVRRIRQAIKVRRESPESYVFLLSASWLYPGSLYRVNTRWLESDPENETFQVARAMQVYTSKAKADPTRAAEFEHIPPPEQLLEKYPHNVELVAYFLNHAIADGDLERVQVLLKSVPQELADADSRFWRARAWCEDTTGQFDLAEKYLRQAFSLDRYWWLVHFQLHDLFRRLGRLDESAKFFKIQKIAKELSIEIMNLNHTPESLDEKRFCRSLLVLAELIEDDEVATALRERVGTVESSEQSDPEAPDAIRP